MSSSCSCPAPPAKKPPESPGASARNSARGLRFSCGATKGWECPWAWRRCMWIGQPGSMRSSPPPTRRSIAPRKRDGTEWYCPSPPPRLINESMVASDIKYRGRNSIRFLLHPSSFIISSPSVYFDLSRLGFFALGERDGQQAVGQLG